MKKTIFLCLFCFLSLVVKSQVNIDSLMNVAVPHRSDIQLNCEKWIMRYYYDNKFDSAKIVLQYWELKNGMCDDLFKTKVLFAIKENNFTESMYDSTVINKNVMSNYTDNSWMYNAVYKDFALFLNKLALEFLPKQVENSAAQFLCYIYSDDRIDPFVELQKQDKYRDTKIKYYYEKAVNSVLRKPDFLYSIELGTLNFDGNASLLGSGFIVELGIGVKVNKMTYKFACQVGGRESGKSYIIKRNNLLDTTNFYSLRAVGVSVGRDLFGKRSNKLYMIGGLGYAGLSTLKSNKTDVNPNNDKDYELNSFNGNVGIGFNHFGGNVIRYNCSIQANYNFVNFDNKGGTSLSGNYYTLSLIFTLFFNDDKSDQMENLRCAY